MSRGYRNFLSHFSFKAKTKVNQLEVISLLVSLGKDQKEKILEEIKKKKEEESLSHDLKNDPFFL